MEHGRSSCGSVLAVGRWSAAALAIFGCPVADETSTAGSAHPFDECDTDSPEGDGVWDPQQEDWVNVSDNGATVDLMDSPCDNPGAFISHHCFLTAVHAIHMHTGELLLYHGERDTRVWPIGSPPEDMRWQPTPYQSDWVEPGPDGCEPGVDCVLNPVVGWPDTFCTGSCAAPQRPGDARRWERERERPRRRST